MSPDGYMIMGGFLRPRSAGPDRPGCKGGSVDGKGTKGINYGAQRGTVQGKED